MSLLSFVSFLDMLQATFSMQDKKNWAALNWKSYSTLKRSAFIVMKVTFWTIDKNDRNM